MAARICMGYLYTCTHSLLSYQLIVIVMVHRPMHEEEKFVVGHSALCRLVEICPCCAGKSRVSLKTTGATVVALRTCGCGETTSWSNSPNVPGTRLSSLDLNFSAAILFAGVNYGDIHRFAKSFNLRGVNESAYYDHQKDHLHKVNWRNGWGEIIRAIGVVKSE